MKSLLLLSLLFLSGCASIMEEYNFSGQPKKQDMMSSGYYQGSWQQEMIENAKMRDPKLWEQLDKAYSDDTVVITCSKNKDGLDDICIGK